MHEAATIQGAVHIILDALHQSGASHVSSVQLTLGVSGHFSEEAVRHYFQLFTKDTPIQDASLVISWLPATFQCLTCHHRFKSTLADTLVTCPLCGESALEIDHSERCSVSAITVLSEEEYCEQPLSPRGSQP